MRGIHVTGVVVMPVVVKIVQQVSGLSSISHSGPTEDLLVSSKRSSEPGISRVALSGLDDGRPGSYKGQKIRRIDVFAYVGMKPSPAWMVAVIPDHAQIRRECGWYAHGQPRIEAARDSRDLAAH